MPQSEAVVPAKLKLDVQTAWGLATGIFPLDATVADVIEGIADRNHEEMNFEVPLVGRSHTDYFPVDHDELVLDALRGVDNYPVILEKPASA